jgi:ribose transport system substrate-binding protein
MRRARRERARISRRATRRLLAIPLIGIAVALTIASAGSAKPAPADHAAAASNALAAAASNGLIGFNNLGEVKCGEFCVDVQDGVQKVFPAASYKLFITDGNLDANTMLANAQLQLEKKPKLYLDFDGGITNYKVTIAEFNKAHIPLFLLAGGPPPAGTKNVWWFGSASYASGVADAKAVIAYAKANGWDGKINGVFASYAPSWTAQDKGRVYGFAYELHKYDPSVSYSSMTLFDGSFAGSTIAGAATAFLNAHTGDDHLIFYTPTSDEDGISIIGAMDQLGRQSDAVIATIGGDTNGLAQLRSATSPIIAEIGYEPQTWGQQLLPIVKNILAGKHVPYDLYYKYQVLTKANINKLYPLSK